MRNILSSKYFWAILGLLLSGVTLFLALSEVSLWEVSRQVRQASTLWVVLAVGNVLVNTFMKGFRWYRLTGSVGRKVGIRRVIAANVAGQLLNLIYPARAGDVSRVLIVGQDGHEKAFVLGSVALDKLADLVAFVLFAAILLVQLPFPSWLNKPVYLTAGITVIGVVFIIWWLSNADRGERLGYWLVKRKARWMPEPTWLYLIEMVQMTLKAISLVRQRKLAFELSLWTVLVWLTALLNNILIWYALGLSEAHPGQVLPASWLLLIGLMAGVALPSVPGRFGIFEYICILALAVFGVAQAQALTYGIILHAVVLLPALVLGAAALLWLSWKPSGQPAES
jgi:uncharacterized protein (TIRG00374 family)